MLNEQGFDLWADGYDASVGLSDEDDSYPFAGYKKVLGSIYRQVMAMGRPDVLDIGFGTGVLTAKLYDGGCRIFGQDFSPRMIAKAQEKMPEATLMQGDFSQGLCGALKTRRYDAIIATYSLHHLNLGQKIRFIGELLPCLTENGRILIGDVAFETAKEQAACAQDSGDTWDADEFYFVMEELQDGFLIPMTFEKLSHCAGVITLAAK